MTELKDKSMDLITMGKAFGIQIKPITANLNFGNYKITERMSASFRDFEKNMEARYL